MEETIVPTVLWAWLVSCGIWIWSSYRLARWEKRLRAKPPHHVRRARQHLSGLLVGALVIIGLYWPGLPTRSWLLPFRELDQPLLNYGGLLMVRIALMWIVVMTVQRERWYWIWWHQRSLSAQRWWYWEPYYAGKMAIGGAGLLLGLFLSLSGVVTAGLCVTGGWFGWRLWQAYPQPPGTGSSH